MPSRQKLLLIHFPGVHTWTYVCHISRSQNSRAHNNSIISGNMRKNLKFIALEGVNIKL
jgi:hypothetical protein